MSTIPPRPDLGLPPHLDPARRRRRRILVGAAAVVALLVVSSVLYWAVPQIRVCTTTRRLLNEAAALPSTGGPPKTLSGLRAYLPDTTTVHSEKDGQSLWTSPRDVAEGRTGESEWISRLTDTGFSAGIFRQWRTDDGGLLQAQVMQFPTHADALAFQDWIIYASCLNARVAFTVAGVPGSIGLRIYWPDHDISEQVSFVRGSRRYLAALRAGSIPPRNEVLAITNDLSATAA